MVVGLGGRGLHSVDSEYIFYKTCNVQEATRTSVTCLISQKM